MDARERYDEICDDLSARNPEVVLTQMMGMPAVKADGKLVCGWIRSEEAMVFKLPDEAAHAGALGLEGAHLFDPGGNGGPSRSGWSCRTLTPPSGRGSRSRRSHNGSLERPVLGVGADRRPGEDDPPDRVDVERDLAEVGRVRLRQLLEPQVDLPGELRHLDLLGRQALHVHVGELRDQAPLCENQPPRSSSRKTTTFWPLSSTTSK